MSSTSMIRSMSLGSPRPLGTSAQSRRAGGSEQKPGQGAAAERLQPKTSGGSHRSSIRPGHQSCMSLPTHTLTGEPKTYAYSTYEVDSACCFFLGSSLQMGRRACECVVHCSSWPEALDQMVLAESDSTLRTNIFGSIEWVHCGSHSRLFSNKKSAE